MTWRMVATAALLVGPFTLTLSAQKKVEAAPYFNPKKQAGVIAPAAVPGGPENLDAGKYFGTGGPPTIYIETDKTQVLTFNAQHGDYVLNGKDLDIDADTVEVTGNVVIRAFKDGEHPPDENTVAGAGPNGATGGACGRNGCRGQNGADGLQGPKGTKGADGVHAKLKIAHIVGNGSLTVLDNGAGGGRGGVGGAGGNGGYGGKGAARACGDWMGRDKDGPGDGGAPGDGGYGGVGGIGGDGGAAGNIDFTKDLKPYIDTKKLKLEAKAGTPGTGGPGGLGGGPGTRGDGGDGAACGGGGTPGRPDYGADRRGQRSGDGPKPDPGPDGVVTCYNCKP